MQVSPIIESFLALSHRTWAILSPLKEYPPNAWIGWLTGENLTSLINIVALCSRKSISNWLRFRTMRLAACQTSYFVFGRLLPISLACLRLSSDLIYLVNSQRYSQDMGWTATKRSSIVYASCHAPARCPILG